MISAFLRNDDVRGVLDDSLVYLTEKMVSAGLPVTHAVEPANVTPEVTAWLLDARAAHPESIEIIQHGFDHTIKTSPPYRGEFGNGRSFEDQLDDIRQGANMMDEFFGDNWNRIFSFPYGAYNADTLKALEQSSFETISTGIRFTLKRKVLNTIGHVLGKKQLLGKNIVYFNEQVPRFAITEIPVVISNTRQQTGPDTAVQYSAEELTHRWGQIPGSVRTRGILSHHRFNKREDIDALIEFMLSLKAQNVHFTKIGQINEKMDNM